MCESCAGRSERLEELIAQFQAMIAAEPDPLAAHRLRRALEDLKASAPKAAEPCRGCDCDVVWADEPAVA